jgi:hypothetical protein
VFIFKVRLRNITGSYHHFSLLQALCEIFHKVNFGLLARPARAIPGTQEISRKTSRSLLGSRQGIFPPGDYGEIETKS